MPFQHDLIHHSRALQYHLSISQSIRSLAAVFLGGHPLLEAPTCRWLLKPDVELSDSLQFGVGDADV